MTKNVFVMGLNQFNAALLETVRCARECRFHTLLDNAEVEEPPVYRVKELLEEARGQLRAFPGSIDAIVGYIDMPVGFMVPILCREWGLPSPSLESVLRCQHKYWSRLLQREVIPEHTPPFNLVNPFAEDPASQIDLGFPFWLKPVKSAGSYLGFRIDDPGELDARLETIRRNIRRLSDPFNYVLQCAEIPPELAGVDFSHCIAEEITPGRQCTLEGYVYHGEFRVYGVVDSVRHGNRATFARYQYPSRLPARIKQRMVDIAARVIAHTGLDDSPFNVELFWNERSDRIWLLEINTRISQSHSYLFWKVDGASNHEIMVDVGLGRRPAFPRRQGEYRHAAKFFLRIFEDATVLFAPGPERVRRVERDVPGSRIKLNVRQGMKLRHLLEQDSYSYDIAWIFVAAGTPAELAARYRRCVDGLGVQLGP